MNILDVDLGMFRPKTRNELSDQVKTNFTFNAKAMNILYNTLHANEFTRAKGCKSAKEV